MPTKSLIELAIIAVKNAPRTHGGKGIAWSTDINIPTAVAAAINLDTHPRDTVKHISEATNVSEHVLTNISKGLRSDGQRWPELRAALKAYGVTWPDKGNTPNVASKVDGIAALPKAIEPAADDVPPAKFTVLAVTANGNVEPATLPTAATTPKAMVAGAGDFFMATPGLQVGACVGLAGALAIEPVTGDCFVVTTERVCYGTARWCELMRDHATKKAAPSA